MSFVGAVGTVFGQGTVTVRSDQAFSASLLKNARGPDSTFDPKGVRRSDDLVRGFYSSKVAAQYLRG
jgi:hypothetical protein